TGITVSISGNIDALPTAYLFQGAGLVSLTTAPWVSVAWWGAMVDSDFAPSIRAAVGSNRIIYVPPATYIFKSAVVPGALPAANLTGVFIDGFSNFTISAHGATFEVDDATAAKTFTHFTFYNDRNFFFYGGAITGNRSGITSNAENGGIFLV